MNRKEAEARRKYKQAARAGVLLLAVVMVITVACSVSMRKNLPGIAVDPEGVIERLKSLGESLQSDKQIFRVRLLDKGRTFSGDGALLYRAPDTLMLSIYGPPFTTLWIQMLTRGDSLTLVLPKENRVVRTLRSDPVPVAQLAGSEGLTDAVFLGGVTGIFDIDRFRSPGMSTMAAKEGDIERLRLVNDTEAYEFVYDRSLDAVVRFIHYRKGKKHREIARSEFVEIQGIKRASRTLYRDYSADREITVLVSKEEINPELDANAFKLLILGGS
ncbi:MAG: hypothetical protein U9N45_07280 [Gemmatimonadota bacterium]|nr:hypothetical protein [Gemmatimonadota bacterium]